MGDDENGKNKIDDENYDENMKRKAKSELPTLLHKRISDSLFSSHHKGKRDVYISIVMIKTHLG